MGSFGIINEDTRGTFKDNIEKIVDMHEKKWAKKAGWNYTPWKPTYVRIRSHSLEPPGL